MLFLRRFRNVIRSPADSQRPLHGGGGRLGTRGGGEGRPLSFASGLLRVTARRRKWRNEKPFKDKKRARRRGRVGGRGGGNQSRFRRHGSQITHKTHLQNSRQRMPHFPFERYEMKRLDGRLSRGDLPFELQIRALLVQSWNCKKKKEKKKNPQ